MQDPTAAPGIVEVEDVESKDGLPSALRDFEALGPEADPLELSEGVYSITPMRMKQIRAFIQVGQNFIGPLMQGIKDNGEVDVGAIAGLDQEAFVKALSIASGITVDQLDEMLPDDFIKVVAKVLVVNMDFFALRLPTVLRQIAGVVGKSFESAKRKIEQSGLAASLKQYRG